MRRSKIYLIEKETNKRIPLLACPDDCKVCELWRTKHNTWLFFEYFPVHCYLCCHAGYPDDFHIINKSVILCDYCRTNNYLKAIKYYLKNKSLYNFKISYK